jgi:hypothetical protein
MEAMPLGPHKERHPTKGVMTGCSEDSYKKFLK